MATNHPIAVFKQTGFGGNTDTSQGLVIDITGMATGRAFEIKNNAVNNVTVLNNGNVGIGTTTPSERLEVNGIIRATPIVGQWVHTVMQYPTSDSTNDAIILFGTEELNTSSEYYQLESNGSGVTIKKAGIYYIVGTTDSLTNTYTGRADLHLHTGTNHLMTIIYQIRSAGADTYNHYTIDTVANIAANSKISLGWSTQTLVSWFMHSSLSHLRIMRLN